MKKKENLYKTAFWAGIGQYVKLIKYHIKFQYYDIETISGEKEKVSAHELSNFTF
jgi:hypothetical protein